MAPTTFLSLPPELRNKIYRDVFTENSSRVINTQSDPTWVRRIKTYLFKKNTGRNTRSSRIWARRDLEYALCSHCSEDPFERTPYGSWVNVPKNPVRTGILYACRQTYHEASSVLYNEIKLFHNLSVDSWWQHPSNEDDSMDDPSGAEGQYHIGYIRSTTMPPRAVGRIKRLERTYDPSGPKSQFRIGYLPSTTMPLSALGRIKRLKLTLDLHLASPEPYPCPELNFFAIHAPALESLSLRIEFCSTCGDELYAIKYVNDLPRHLARAIRKMTHLRTLVVGARGFCHPAGVKFEAIQRCVEALVEEGGWKLLVAECQPDSVPLPHFPDARLYRGYWRLSR